MRWWKRGPASALAHAVPVLEQLRSDAQRMRLTVQRLHADLVAVSVALDQANAQLERLAAQPALQPMPPPQEFTHERRQR